MKHPIKYPIVEPNCPHNDPYCGDCHQKLPYKTKAEERLIKHILKWSNNRGSEQIYKIYPAIDAVSREVSKRLDPFDRCKCGHFRDEHKREIQDCSYSNDLCECKKFVLAEKYKAPPQIDYNKNLNVKTKAEERLIKAAIKFIADEDHFPWAMLKNAVDPVLAERKKK